MSNVGLDCGTSFFVSATQEDKNLIVKSIRNSYLPIKKYNFSKGLINDINDLLAIEDDENYYIIGDKALYLAASFTDAKLQRPFVKGILNPKDSQAYNILKSIVSSLLVKPNKGEKPVCYFSIPAEPLDSEAMDAGDLMYHASFLEDLISSLGYKAKALNEAHAISFRECAESNFTGLCFSFGAGMSNICLSNITVDVLNFSLLRGGDWIDNGSAKSLGTNSAITQMIKEEGNFSLLDPKTREQKVIAIFYKNLIKYVLEHFAERFSDVKNQLFFKDKFPIIISGGTSKALDFVGLFKTVYEDLVGDLLPISEIRHANDPLSAVAEGLYVKATL